MSNRQLELDFREVARCFWRIFTNEVSTSHSIPACKIYRVDTVSIIFFMFVLLRESHASA